MRKWRRIAKPRGRFWGAGDFLPARPPPTAPVERKKGPTLLPTPIASTLCATPAPRTVTGFTFRSPGSGAILLRVSAPATLVASAASGSPLQPCLGAVPAKPHVPREGNALLRHSDADTLAPRRGRQPSLDTFGSPFPTTDPAAACATAILRPSSVFRRDPCLVSFRHLGAFRGVSTWCLFGFPLPHHVLTSVMLSPFASRTKPNRAQKGCGYRGYRG